VKRWPDLLFSCLGWPRCTTRLIRTEDLEAYAALLAEFAGAVVMDSGAAPNVAVMLALRGAGRRRGPGAGLAGRRCPQAGCRAGDLVMC